MRVGITYIVQHSIFGSGRGQTAITLGLVFKKLGHDVILINKGAKEQAWYDDGPDISGLFLCRHFTECERGRDDNTQIDLLVDIDGSMSYDLRKKISDRVVVFLRKRILFDELDKCSYMQHGITRDMAGVCEVWIWDILNPENEMEAIHSLFKLPIVRVPFVWSSMVLEEYLRLSGQDAMKGGCVSVGGEPWLVRIGEKNVNNSSSAVLPLVTLYHAQRTGAISFKGVYIHNGTDMENNKFFIENVMNNVDIHDATVKYVGRERYADWLADKNTIVLTHIRFCSMRPGLIDLAWLGIPFIHNSPILRNIGNGNGCGLDKIYYEGNNISDATNAIAYSILHVDEWNASVMERRKAIEAEWAIEKHLNAWKEVVDGIGTRAVLKTVMMTAPAAPIVPVNSNKNTPKKHIVVGFTDMWDGFMVAENFFIDILSHECAGYTFEGVHAKNAADTGYDILFFGPFGNSWETLNTRKNGSHIPTIFFTGENWDMPISDAIDLYISSSRKEDARHTRIPIWMLFLHWYTASGDTSVPDIDKKSLKNPVGLPLSLATEPHRVPCADRKEFCSYVVSNPCNDVRNNAFTAVNAYKRVNSGGQLFNNIGGPLHARYAGGGCGDIAKFKFLEEHKFNICYENSRGNGYVTEKLLHAKMAGCVPIYWGDPNADTDFDPAGFINLSSEKDTNKIIEVIKELEADPEKCQKMAALPALGEVHLARARDTLHRLAHRLLNMALGEEGEYNSKNSEKQLAVAAAAAPVQLQSSSIPSPIFASYITEMYAGSVELNIQAIERHKSVSQDIRYIIFLGTDVTTKTKDILQTRHPWIELRNVPRVSPSADFPDFWESRHFGWKLWILRELAHDPELNGKLIVYTDAGAQWIRLPSEFFMAAAQEGICVVRDMDNINRYWCSDEMVKRMSVSENELSQNQIVAGFISFLSGHTLSKKTFSEAYEWGLQKDVLCGRRLIGVLPSGQNYGHRHDQSILSIIAYRNKLVSILAEAIICEQSLRRTFLLDKHIYLHRGEYVSHAQALSGIDDVWVISLDRRADRWESWKKANPTLAKLTNRFHAIDGKSLRMTQNLFTFFEGNDFLWKKNIAGCALSHIMVWLQLAAEKKPVRSYFIMEDDMRFLRNDWAAVWEKASQVIPADADLLYLGGVLPINRDYYQMCVAPVNDYWGVIKVNNLFTPKHPQAIFHFCAYSYILTKKGAEKLLAALKQCACTTSLDHVLGTKDYGLKRYVMRECITGCFQDDDPVYKYSEFDNFKRIDTFDSDIWNNVDVFNDFVDLKVKQPVKSVWLVANEVAQYNSMNPVSTKLLSRASYLQYLESSGANDEIQDILSEDTSTTATGGIITPQKSISPNENVFSPTIYYYDEHNGTEQTKYITLEINWLREFWPKISFKRLTSPKELLHNPWFLVSRPHISFWKRICKFYEDSGRDFYILHTSDEMLEDDIRFYDYKHCKYIVRNYVRSPACDTYKDKLYTLPLGYSRRFPQADIKPLSTRKHVWAFHGTNWFNRKTLISPLLDIQPNSCHFTPDWNHSSMTSYEEYCKTMLDTKFCPIMRGNHFETFRLYEALEMGCIPLYVRNKGDNVYWEWLSQHIGLMEIQTWESAKQVMLYLLEHPEDAQAYADGIQRMWNKWKADICIQLRTISSV